MNELMNSLKKQKELLESQGHSVAYICIYGSQNYGLDLHTEEYESDIDMKAIIVPTLDDLIKDSKPISTTIDTEWGQCDLKDIRPYFQTLLKANPAYIETLYTDYYIVDDKFMNEFDSIFNMRDELAKTLSAQMIRAMYGMMCEKEKALCHPYPTIAHKIEKFGYDGKQISHAYRLLVMMDDYFKKELPLKRCLFPSNEHLDTIMALKLNEPSLEFAKEMIKDIMSQGKALRDNVLENIDEGKIDYSIKSDFLNLSQKIIKNKIIEECKLVGGIY